MANQGAKKRLDENRKRLQNLRIALVIGLVLHFVVRIVLRQGYNYWSHLIGFWALLFIGVYSYKAISNFAEPEFNEKGEVVYGGADLSMGGVCAYWHDLLYISIFVQVTTCISTYFWYTYLVVPAFMLYLLFKHVLLPYWKQARAPPVAMDEATRKRLERTQQRAERRKMKWR